MNFNEKNTPTRKGIYYLIKVKGILNRSWSDWFSDIEIVPGEEAEGSPFTIFRGEFPDQAALRGVLTKLWDLNMTVISVYRVGPAEEDFKNYGGSNNV